MHDFFKHPFSYYLPRKIWSNSKISQWYSNWIPYRRHLKPLLIFGRSRKKAAKLEGKTNFTLKASLKSRTPLHMDGGLDHFFPNSVPLDLAKDGFTIIWRFSKNKNFPKIWRLWLKNCACHAHFNFEFLKGMAVLFCEICPWNFDHLWIFYRQKKWCFIHFSASLMRKLKWKTAFS